MKKESQKNVLEQLVEYYSRKLPNPSSLVSPPRSTSRNVTFPLHSVGLHSKSASASDRNDSEKGTEHDDVNSFPFLVSLSILSVRGANVSKTNCRSLCPISAGEFEQERERRREKRLQDCGDLG